MNLKVKKTLPHEKLLWFALLTAWKKYMGEDVSFLAFITGWLKDQKDSPASGADPHQSPPTPLLKAVEKGPHEDEALIQIKKKLRIKPA